MNKASFIQVFGLPELNSIMKNWMGMLFLLFMVVLSFWCIGFSAGSDRHLEEKMNSPFVRFVSVELPTEISYNEEKMESLEKWLDHARTKEIYHFGNYNYVAFRAIFFQSSEGKARMAKMRSVGPTEELYDFLFDKDNVITTSSVSLAHSPWSIVITEEFLKTLGYSIKNAPGYINYLLFSSGVDIEIPLAIAAIVRQLPNDCQVIGTNKLYTSIEGRLGFQNPIYPDLSAHKLYYRIFVESIDREEIEVLLQESFSYAFIEERETYKPGVTIEFSNLTEGKRIENLLKNEYIVHRIYNYDSPNYPTYNYRRTYDNLVVQFSDLEKIDIFHEELMDRHKLTIDMNSIEAKDNFLLFSKISAVLSIILSSFSVVFIITYLTRIIIEHIDRNSKNLGTLKAFGLSNMNIGWIYSGISSLIIITIFLISFFIASIIGITISPIALEMYGINSDSVTELFILRMNYYMVLLFVVVPLIITSLLIYFKIKNQTPGDLIYER